MEQTLLDTIYLFNLEAQRLHATKPGAALTLTVSYTIEDRWGEPEPKTTLFANFYDGRNYATIEAASLDALMGEVYRRLGFADRETIRTDALNASLKALPAPNQDQPRGF